MPRIITMKDVRQDPVVRKHMIGLILCGAALVLDVALSFSPMFWYYRYDVLGKGFTFEDLFELKINRPRHLPFGDEEQPVTTQIGLWQSCLTEGRINNDPKKKCWMHNEKESRLLGAGGEEFAKYFGVTQLFQCFGLLFLFVAVLTSFMKLFCFWDNKSLIPLGTAHAFWGAVSFIGSAVAFGVGIKNASTPSVDLRKNLHFSFAFAVISGVVALAGALVLRTVA